MKHIVAIFLAALLATTALASAACDTNTSVPPTPPPAESTALARPTPIAEATRIAAVPTPTHLKSEWQLFTSAAGKFSIQMPSNPLESTQPVQDALGNLILHSFAAEDGSAAYTLFYTDFPDAIQNANPSDLLNAALTRVEGENTVTNQKKIDVQGNPGVQVEGENGNKGYMRYKAVLAKTRLFELIVLTPNKDASAQDAGRFLDSFKLSSQ